MKFFILTLILVALFASSCEREDVEKQRYITSSIVGTWWTKTASDSIIHEYSNYGKLSIKEFSSNILRYTGEYDFDVIDDLTMEYWGERLDGTTPFYIYSNDTLQLNSFNGRSYLLFRVY